MLEEIILLAVLAVLGQIILATVLARLAWRLRRRFRDARHESETSKPQRTRDMNKELDRLIGIAAGLNEPVEDFTRTENDEYFRGQCELLADAFGTPGVFTADRKEEVAKLILERIRKLRSQGGN